MQCVSLSPDSLFAVTNDRVFDSNTSNVRIPDRDDTEMQSDDDDGDDDGSDSEDEEDDDGGGSDEVSDDVSDTDQ